MNKCQTSVHLKNPRNSTLGVKKSPSTLLIVLTLVEKTVWWESGSVSTYGFGDDPHRFWVLVCKKCQQGCEGTETSSEQDEEWQLFLWVDRHIVKCYKNEKINDETCHIHREHNKVEPSMGDHPLLWATTLMGDHPYGRPHLWTTTLMSDHHYGRQPLWATTIMGERHAMRDHPNGRPPLWATTIMGDSPYERPSILTRDHPFL